MKKIILLLLPIFLFSNDEIQRLFLSNSYEEACKLSDALYLENPDTFEANLYYAKCAQHRGEIDKAIAAYDKADILKEDDANLHKYLGDLHVDIGNIQIANEEYDKADRFSNYPVERALTKDYSAHKFSTLLSISSGYDSNVDYNAELTDMQNWLGALPSTEDKPSADSFVKEYIRLSHVYDSNPYDTFYYKTQLHLYNKNYFRLHESDFLQSNITSGVGFASNSFDIWLPLRYKYIATSYDSYANAYAFNPKFRMSFSNKVLLSIQAMYEKQNYTQWSGADKSTVSADIEVSKWIGQNYFKLSYGYLDTSKDDSSSNSLFIDKTFNELELDYTYKFTSKFEFGLGYLYRKSKYTDLIKRDSQDLREDKLSLYSAYLSYNVNKSFLLITKYDNYNNDTNYIPFLYKKQVLSFGLYYYY